MSLGNCLFRFLVQFLIKLFYIESHESFVYFWILTPHIIDKNFLPFSRLSFHFVTGFLCCPNAF